MIQKKGGYRPPKKRARRLSNLRVIAGLVFLWPVGMAAMWSRRCRWSRMNKMAVSLGSTAVVAILVVTMLGVIQRNERTIGGVQVVYGKPMVDVYGPPAPANVEYSYDSVLIDEAEIVTAAPTEEPEMAFANAGGRYFHSENCKYVTTKSHAYTVPYLLGQGFKPCEECAARELAGY